MIFFSDDDEVIAPILVPAAYFPKSLDCIFSWKKKSERQETTIVIGKEIDILEVLFPTEIEHKIKGKRLGG